jgi:hypothetical protein
VLESTWSLERAKVLETREKERKRGRRRRGRTSSGGMGRDKGVCANPGNLMGEKSKVLVAVKNQP